MLFSGWHKEVFPTTQITGHNTKTIQILNESAADVQHVVSVGWYANSNKVGHFQISGVKVGQEKVGEKDIFIPPMGVLNLEVTYAPLSLVSSEADFGGWVTTADSRMEEEGEPAIHRAVVVIAYDSPKEGYVNIELVGTALPGPNGEVMATPVSGGAGECNASGKRACFIGTFSIDLPGLMSGGALEVPLYAPIPLTIDAGIAEIDMDEFPPIVIPLKGNGPGEPLEGKPVDAVTIIISGTPETTAKGSFDGVNLTLSDVSFRVRVDLGEITYDDITPGLTTAVDFNIPGLEITTDEPFDGNKITFGVETTLSSTPSGNGLFDAFLANAKVVVRFSGKLELP